MKNNYQSKGYLWADDRKVIRNITVIICLVEFVHHVARAISSSFSNEEVYLIVFPGCYPNQYANRIINAICIHPNLGAVLLVSLGCESFNRKFSTDMNEILNPHCSLIPSNC